MYPSYGDTYPTYNGAIGMTYEQAGHGYAGLGIITEYGDTLTLKDRIAHHYTTGISTVEIASLNAKRLGQEFVDYFELNTSKPQAKYKSYIIRNDNQDKVKSLMSFLDKHKIDYGKLGNSKTVKGFSYVDGVEKSYSANENDLLISAYQPTSRLVTALFEPKTKLSDSLTYDITAWSLPYAHGLEAYALVDKLTPSGDITFASAEETISEKAYAYVSKYNSLEDVKWLAYLLRQGVNARVAQKPITIKGNTFERGSVVITQRNNENIKGGIDELIRKSAKEFDRSAVAVTTGFADAGVDLGSSSVAKIETPKIAVLAGDQTSSLSYGEIWHFFERQIDYPITSIGTDYFSWVNLDEYNVFIIPHGYYR